MHDGSRQTGSHSHAAAAAPSRDFPRELHPSAEMVSALLESAAQAIVATDVRGRIVLTNGHTGEMFGYSRSELLGASVEMLLPAAKRERHEQLRAQYLQRPTLRPMGTGMDLHGRRKDGTEFPVEVGLSHIETAEGRFVIAFVTDLSHRKRLEQQLLHAQKLDALGRLASGVAHDFNNMLTAISASAGLLWEQLGSQDALRRHVEVIMTAADRAATLTGQLLTFGRQQPLRPQIVDLNTVVAAIQRMLHRLIGDDIAIELKLQPGLGHIQADPSRIEQAIVNLAINSRDAMPNGGRIGIETADVTVGRGEPNRHATVEPGEYIRISVADTGTGMDRETQRRLFEPFFTTKEPGKGTGLGLATVFGTVKQARGAVCVHSEPGNGTIVELYFPRVHHPEIALAGVDPAGPHPTTGQGTVLVVEDNATVRSVIVAILEQIGYQVIAAGNGPEAIELSRSYRDSIDLLVADLVMPKMSGRQVAGTLVTERPNLKVLYLSGYPETFATEYLPGPSAPFLQKPFSRDDLARAIGEVLDKESL